MSRSFPADAPEIEVHFEECYRDDCHNLAPPTPKAMGLLAAFQGRHMRYYCSHLCKQVVTRVNYAAAPTATCLSCGGPVYRWTETRPDYCREECKAERAALIRHAYQDLKKNYYPQRKVPAAPGNNPSRYGMLPVAEVLAENEAAFFRALVYSYHLRGRDDVGRRMPKPRGRYGRVRDLSARLIALRNRTESLEAELRREQAQQRQQAKLDAQHATAVEWREQQHAEAAEEAEQAAYDPLENIF